MVLTATDEFEVAATPEQVMAALEAVERLPEWSPTHKEVEVESRHSDGRPRRVRQKLSVFGMTDVQVVEHTWSGNESMSWTLVESRMQKTQDGSYTLTPTDSGTAVSTKMAVDPKVRIPQFAVDYGQKRALKSFRKKLIDFVETNFT